MVDFPEIFLNFSDIQSVLLAVGSCSHCTPFSYHKFSENFRVIFPEKFHRKFPEIFQLTTLQTEECYSVSLRQRSAATALASL